MEEYLPMGQSTKTLTALRKSGKQSAGVAPEDAKRRGEEGEEGTFAIALLREEIEEDVFAMTGARPSRTGLQRTK
ncbi:hypothetical protein RJ640_003168 [Escallonia rubra]|uniref:Uncharacterized protein n=1 Tax=Escallonia rubra TaxID=112253 RepID=A0AA88UMU6_9ASTE|nr:hypothetical protein RJ640_003168 [Escallonia rubra]